VDEVPIVAGVDGDPRAMQAGTERPPVPGPAVRGSVKVVGLRDGGAALIHSDHAHHTAVVHRLSAAGAVQRPSRCHRMSTRRLG